MRLKDTKCQLAGCETSYYARGLCKTHYMREFRPNFAPTPRKAAYEGVWERIVEGLGIEGANKRKVMF